MKLEHNSVTLSAGINGTQKEQQHQTLVLKKATVTN